MLIEGTVRAAAVALVLLAASVAQAQYFPDPADMVRDAEAAREHNTRPGPKKQAWNARWLPWPYADGRTGYAAYEQEDGRLLFQDTLYEDGELAARPVGVRLAIAGQLAVRDAHMLATAADVWAWGIVRLGLRVERFVLADREPDQPAGFTVVRLPVAAQMPIGEEWALYVGAGPYWVHADEQWGSHTLLTVGLDGYPLPSLVLGASLDVLVGIVGGAELRGTVGWMLGPVELAVGWSHWLFSAGRGATKLGGPLLTTRVWL